MEGNAMFTRVKKWSGTTTAIVIAAVAALMLMVAPATRAGALPPLTDVTGVVTDENGDAVGNAQVSVTCGTKNTMDMTDAKGAYLVSFSAIDCPFGATVKVVATKNGKTGKATGTVHGITTKLNIAIVNVQIPEYGLIGSLVAGGLGIGAISFYRRRAVTNGSTI